MALQLSAHKPRAFAYAAGGLRTDLRLLEVDEHLLQEIQTSDVVIKGAAEDEAVLCTADKTYALKLVDTTNTLLLLPPQEELDEEFRAIPSLATAGKDASGLRDTGLQTQLAKNAASKDYPPLVATATVASHLEVIEVAPRLDGLPRLLGRPYSLEDEDEGDEQPQPQTHTHTQQQGPGTADAAAGLGTAGGGIPASVGLAGSVGAAAGSEGLEAMEADGPGAAAPVPAVPASTRPRPDGCFTSEELLERVQASRAELLAELQRLQAVQLGGCWRRIDAAYLGSLLEMLVASAIERGWRLDEPIALADAAAALQPEGYKPALVRHCLHVYATPCPSDWQQSAADGSGSPAAAGDDSSGCYTLDERRVCLHYARKLLQQQPLWPRAEFLAAWAQEVPGGCWQPREDMLAGEALLLQPDAHAGFSEPRLRHFPASALPAAPGPRFAALFAAQARWTRQQMEPYLEGLRVPGQTVEQLLLKHARASHRSPTDSTLVFVSR